MEWLVLQMNYIPLQEDVSAASHQHSLEPRRQPKGNYAGVTKTDEVWRRAIHTAQLLFFCAMERSKVSSVLRRCCGMRTTNFRRNTLDETELLESCNSDMALMHNFLVYNHARVFLIIRIIS